MDYIRYYQDKIFEDSTGISEILCSVVDVVVTGHTIVSAVAGKKIRVISAQISTEQVNGKCCFQTTGTPITGWFYPVQYNTLYLEPNVLGHCSTLAGAPLTIGIGASPCNVGIQYIYVKP